MTLDEVMVGDVEVTHNEAIAEVSRHGISLSEFYLELGYNDNYNAATVLQWLGY